MARALRIQPHTLENRVGKLQGYFASITAMDANIGRIIQKLDALELRQNTLILFLSDNGMNMGHHGVWGKGNGTFPINMYDSSVLVPAIVNQPGQIGPGVVSSQLVSGYDVMPALLQYVGVDNPVADSLPGRSFASALTGASSGDERDHVVVYDEYGPVRMIRSEEWKYVHRYPYGPHELFDLVNDPDERVNLADDERRQHVVREMRGTMEEWFIQHTDPRVDGTREEITGRGQLGLAGMARDRRSAFSDQGVNLPVFPGQ